MKLKSLTSVLFVTMASVGMAIPALAAPAVLVGRETGSRVNVRTYPSTQADAPSYGLVGDRVEVIEQREGRDGYMWFCVEFPSGVRGWVRSDFIRYIRN
jgi:uncharacterized protein YraI